jgi:hypothetical protein
MSSHMSPVIQRMIRMYGEDVQHKKRVKTDLGDGEAEYSFVLQDAKRVHWTQATAMDETTYKFSKLPEADYLATALPETDISEYDLLYLDNSWCEVMTVFLRKTGINTDYMEFLLRRVKS